MSSGIRSNLLLRLARTADRVAQRVVPPSPDRVGWISDPDYVGNAFHLYRHLATSRPGYRHVWLVADTAAGGRIRADAVRFRPSMADATTVRVASRRSLRGYLSFLRCGVVFHTHGVYPMVSSARRRQIVNLWHGMPIKAIGALNTRSPNPHPTFGTHHVATSEWFRPVIARAFAVDEDDVIVSGLPRCDVLTETHPLALPAEEIRARVGIVEGRRLVVWMPTYRVSSDRVDTKPPRTFLDDLAETDLDELDDLAGRHGATILVKLHPYDPLNDLSADHGAERDHVRFLRSSDFLALGVELYDLLAVADGLLTDVSSVLIDHLVTDRPIGVVGFDPDAYERDTIIAFDELVGSDRIHDLADGAQRTDFFAAVGVGRPIVTDPTDPAAQWHDAPAGEACEAVLSALGR